MAKFEITNSGGLRLVPAAAVRMAQWLLLGLAALSTQGLRAQDGARPVEPVASVAASAPAVATWQRMPRLQGRLTAADLGLVINSADPYSVAVGEYYARRRGIPEAHVLRVHLPVKPALSLAEFETFNAQLQAQLPPAVQGLALAWSQPYAVECNAITAALAMGFQPELCKQSCGPSRASPYFSYTGARPYSDLGFRPAMLLAARSVE
eukprot:Opistho-1_new@63044